MRFRRHVMPSVRLPRDESGINQTYASRSCRLVLSAAKPNKRSGSSRPTIVAFLSGVGCWASPGQVRDQPNLRQPFL